MKRLRLVLLAGVFVVLPVVSGACGDDNTAHDTLPPIVTTTTTTTILQTTTTYPDFYVLQSGDTLGKVAQLFGTTSAELQAINGIKDPNKVQAGQTIKLPPAPSTTVAVVTTTPGASTTTGG
ncbi:MAG: LysM domain-containing protein [Actinomycetota bacterium]|nr:LysM domain-containing protein [Actinomycetota bacterium]